MLALIILLLWCLWSMECRFILDVIKYIVTENNTKLGVVTLAYNLHTQEPTDILKNKKGMIQCLRVLGSKLHCLPGF